MGKPGRPTAPLRYANQTTGEPQKRQTPVEKVRTWNLTRFPYGTLLNYIEDDFGKSIKEIISKAFNEILTNMKNEKAKNSTYRHVIESLINDGDVKDERLALMFNMSKKITDYASDISKKVEQSNEEHSDEEQSDEELSDEEQSDEEQSDEEHSSEDQSYQDMESEESVSSCNGSDEIDQEEHEENDDMGRCVDEMVHIHQAMHLKANEDEMPNVNEMVYTHQAVLKTLMNTLVTINLNCENKNGKMSVAIERDRPLKCILNAYCGNVGIDFRFSRFKFKRREIYGEETALKLGMKNGDTIDIHHVVNSSKQTKMHFYEKHYVSLLSFIEKDLGYETSKILNNVVDQILTVLTQENINQENSRKIDELFEGTIDDTRFLLLVNLSKKIVNMGAQIVAIEEDSD